MGRRSRRSRCVAVQSRRVVNGRFAKEEDPAELASDDDGLQGGDQRDELDILICHMPQQAFHKMIGQAREGEKPKWYARAGGYNGNSRRTISRKRKMMSETLDAVPMRTIDSYFTRNDTPHHQQHNENYDENVAAAAPVADEGVQARTASSNALAMSIREAYHTRLKACYEVIHEKLNGSNANFSRRSMVQYICIQNCLRFQIDDGLGKVESAKRASSCIPGNSSRAFRCIMNWSSVFLETGLLPQSNQGKHRKTMSLLSDEDVSSRIREWLIAAPKGSRNPDKLANWVNNSLLLEIYGNGYTHVSVRSVRNWMNTLGYKYGVWKKGVFIDGHEREDVVEYRCDFLKRMTSRFQFMRCWEGIDMETALEPECSSETEIVWVSHDESIFYSNDDGGKGWGSDEHPDIHKKGTGRSIMVSDFICPCHGRLRLGNVPVCVIIEPGKNHDGYWQATDILKQLEEKAIPAFDEMHPGARGLFIFDNSTNHGAFAADALVAVASKMNLNAGGKVPVMRETKFVEASSGAEVRQSMVNGEGVPKGLKQVLHERGLWIEKLPKDCKAKFAVGLNPECCALHRLGSQPDFKAQKSILYEALAKTRHICDFLPKFHCELAPIENYWGHAKRYTRANCDYSIVALRKTVPESLDQVPVSSIRKYFRRAAHVMQAYAGGLSYKLAKYAHKKYKSHRRIPEHCMDQIMIEIEE